MGRKAKKGTDTRNDSLKREAAFSCARRKMKEEMDRVWKDFFDKNPHMKEEEVRQRVQKRVKRR